MPAAATPIEFLRALWGDNTGWAELTVINAKGEFQNALPIQYPQYLETLLTESERFNKINNVYMGVCLRRDKWPRKTGKKNIDGTDEMEWRGRESNAHSSMAVWVDLDFKGSHHKSVRKTIDKEVARKMLAEFPLKPSIIVKSGGNQDSGIHVYWLLKEPAVGAELRIVKATNKALATYFAGVDAGADSKAIDLARVLRIPGSINWNLEKPEAAYVSYWFPKRTYTLLDFEQYLEIPKIAEGFTLLPGGQSEPLQTPNSVGASSGHEPRPTPTTQLDDQVCQIIGKLFSKIWLKGSRHEISLYISGWMAFSGVKYESALKIIEIASNTAGGETAQKLNNVRDTYTKFIQGGEVAGKPSLESYIDKEFPEGEMRSFGKKTLEAIQKLLPKPKGFRRSIGEIDFRITNLVKYTSQPPVWTATLEKAGQRLVTKTEHTRFMKYEVFVEDVFDQNGIGPAAGLKNPEWRHLINLAIENGLYEEKPAPEEARLVGAVEKGLEEFLSEAKESPDIGLLKKFPGYDEEATFFRLETFREFLDDQGRKINQNQLTEFLKARGWESQVRRFGKKTPHVWLKGTVAQASGGGDGNSNGNGHGGNGNGHSPTSQEPYPTPSEPEPTSDLFPETSEEETP
jgi:hypothetical protein